MGGIGPTTHLQQKVWMVWLDLQWNRPNRSDYYAMQGAVSTSRQFAKHPERVTLDKMRIEFKPIRKRHPLTEQEKEDITKQSQSQWRSFLETTEKLVVRRAPPLRIGMKEAPAEKVQEAVPRYPKE